MNVKVEESLDALKEKADEIKDDEINNEKIDKKNKNGEKVILNTEAGKVQEVKADITDQIEEFKGTKTED